MATSTVSAELLQELDSLHDKYEYKVLFEKLTLLVKENPKELELLWRCARAHYDKAENLVPKEEKLPLFQQGLELVNTALAINDTHFAPNKWAAILTSSLGDYVSTKEKIGNAFKIQEFLQKALKANPTDATTLHGMGLWCFNVANIGWIERKLASAIFATPPESTYQEALEYYLKSDKSLPNQIRNSLYIANTYAAMKDNKNAKEWYEKTASLTGATDLEKSYVAEAAQKAKSY